MAGTPRSDLPGDTPEVFVKLRGMKSANLAAMFFSIMSALSAHAAKFEPACPLPFSDIALSHPIDAQCDRAGTSTDPRTGFQDVIKNNFCAPLPAAPVALAHLIKLQSLVEKKRIAFGKNNLPQDRAPLENILDGTLGEGKVVSLAGYVVSVRAGNVEDGETANCNLSGAENNTIQISVGSEANAPLCETAFAEISPHFRPKGWELNALTTLQAKKLPVRITGQLFFDAARTACKNDVASTDGSPARLALWEIRPVYAIEVCAEKDVNLCGDGSWKRLALSSSKHIIRRAISKAAH